MKLPGLVNRSKSGSLLVERPELYVQTGSMFENPYGVPVDEIVRFIAENPAEVVAQVVFGKYVESSGLVFTGELIQNLFDRSQPRILGSSYVDQQALDWARRQFHDRGVQSRQNNRFYTGIDFARQTDYTVIFTIDTIRLPGRVVYYRRLNRVPWDSIYAEVGLACHYFGPNILCDSTGPGGDAAMDALENRRYCSVHHRANLTTSRCMKDDGSFLDCNPSEYYPLSCCDGYDFTGSVRKKNLVDHLRVCLGVGHNPRDPGLEFGWLRSPPIPQLEEELSFYAWEDRRLQTDCLFALALAAWAGLEDRVADVLVGSPFGR